MRGELEQYDAQLGRRPEIVAVTKAELPDAAATARSLAEELDREVLAISAVTGQGLDQLLRAMTRLLDERHRELSGQAVRIGPAPPMCPTLANAQLRASIDDKHCARRYWQSTSAIAASSWESSLTAGGACSLAVANIGAAARLDGPGSAWLPAVGAGGIRLDDRQREPARDRAAVGLAFVAWRAGSAHAGATATCPWRSTCPARTWWAWTGWRMPWRPTGSGRRGSRPS